MSIDVAKFNIKYSTVTVGIWMCCSCYRLVDTVCQTLIC